MARPARLFTRLKMMIRASGEGGDLLDARNPHRAVEDHAPSLAQGHGVFEEADVEPHAVHTDVQIIDDALDDLTERQRDDGQVVAVEAEHRDADEEARHGGAARAHDHGHQQPHRRGGKGGLEADRSHRARKAHAHKARVPQRELAQNANRQVQGQGHDHISADRHQLPLKGGAQPAPCAQRLEDHKGSDHHDVGQTVGP